MWKEFKQFAIKGNVIDLAIGVMIGTAFNKIVTSLVNDIIMPIFALILGKASFSDLAYKDLKYGNFIQSIVDFLIIGFTLFLVVKAVNKLQKMREKEDEVKKEEPKPTKEQELLTEIRDLLKVQSKENNL